MQKYYNYAVLYFLLFSIILLASSIALFITKIGLSYSDILHYYLGNERLFLTPKTLAGLLKIILPHIFGFGLFLMVVLHFGLFTKLRKSQKLYLLSIALFTTAFIELFSPIFIILGATFFVYVKLLSFVLFELLTLYALWLLFHAISLR